MEDKTIKGDYYDLEKGIVCYKGITYYLGKERHGGVAGVIAGYAPVLYGAEAYSLLDKHRALKVWYRVGIAAMCLSPFLIGLFKGDAILVACGVCICIGIALMIPFAIVDKKIKPAYQGEQEVGNILRAIDARNGKIDFND